MTDIISAPPALGVRPLAGNIGAELRGVDAAGDLSDEAAGLVGGLGMAPGLSAGRTHQPRLGVRQSPVSPQLVAAPWQQGDSPTP